MPRVGRLRTRTLRPNRRLGLQLKLFRGCEDSSMSERREDRLIQTDRLGAAFVDDGLPTVREILSLDAVVDGLPEVLAGDDALDARVRWVHLSDSAGVARLLDGGELLLSTGSGWPTGPADLDAFIGGLVEAGLS